MLTGRNDFVPSSQDDAFGFQGGTSNNQTDTMAAQMQSDQMSEHDEDTAYKYNDTWTNVRSGQSADSTSDEDESIEAIASDEGGQNDGGIAQETGNVDDEDSTLQYEGGGHGLSQEDIEIFIENESVTAAQTCSQEVRSHHVPNINQSFDTNVEAFEFYNTYAEICGFSVKKASNYRSQKIGESKPVTRYTFKCNRSGKVLDEEEAEKRKRKRDEKRQETKLKKMIERGETQPLQHPAQPTKTRKRNKIEITGCLAEMIVTMKGNKWVVTTLHMDHNHELSPPEESRFLRSHKHMTNEEKLFIRTFNSVKLPTRKIMAILSYLRGGSLKAVPYTKKLVSNLETTMRK